MTRRAVQVRFLIESDEFPELMPGVPPYETQLEFESTHIEHRTVKVVL